MKGLWHKGYYHSSTKKRSGQQAMPGAKIVEVGHVMAEGRDVNQSIGHAEAAHDVIRIVIL